MHHIYILIVIYISSLQHARRGKFIQALLASTDISYLELRSSRPQGDYYD